MTDPGPYEPSAAPAGDKGAELMPRFLARLIDSIIVMVAMLPIVTIAGIGMGFGSITFGILSAVLVVAYFALMETYQGQTLGKMLLKLKTVAPDGGKPSLEAAIKRNAWYLLGIVPFIGGLAQLAVVIYIAVTISQSAMNLGWHDTFAGTKVVAVTA
ncbi:MAG: RDD family protein [Actinomycetota bacterium]